MENDNLILEIIAVINDRISRSGSASLSDLRKDFMQLHGGEITEEQVREAASRMKDRQDRGEDVVYSEEKAAYVYADPTPGYRPGSLSEDEIKELSLAVTLLDHFKYTELFKPFTGLIQKVLDIMQVRSSEKEGQPFRFIDFEKVAASRGSRFLLPLIQAIESGTVVEILYQPFHEEHSHRTIVHPYLLKEYKYRWYLIGLNDLSGELRTYGLERIKDVSVSDRKYIPGTLDAKEYFRHTVGIIAPPGPPPLVRVRVMKPQAQYLITQPWHESQNIEQEDEFSVLFSFRVHPTYEFKSLILGYGMDLEVLEPSFLREEIRSVHEQAARKYQR